MALWYVPLLSYQLQKCCQAVYGIRPRKNVSPAVRKPLSELGHRSRIDPKTSGRDGRRERAVACVERRSFSEFLAGLFLCPATVLSVARQPRNDAGNDGGPPAAAESDADPSDLRERSAARGACRLRVRKGEPSVVPAVPQPGFDIGRKRLVSRGLETSPCRRR